MTVTSLAPLLTPQFFTNAGAPLAAGQLWTYAASSSTPIATYVDFQGVTVNTNPIILNSRGECSVWLLPNVGYKFVLEDALGNTIWTRDQVFNGQLTTLYGGVDTGIVNAYVINYNSPYTTLANGIIIYWIPANTNTGPSTLAVNGLGVVPILNQNGTALSPGQIVASGVTAVFYYNGNWLLTSSTGSVPQSGTFTGQATGGSAAIFCSYSISGYDVNINLPFVQFTSTATTFTMIDVPTVLIPASAKLAPLAAMTNNGAVITNANAILTPVTANTITFGIAGSTTSWSATGVKGIGFSLGFPYAGLGVTLSYNLV
jgi:hypothetical protein